MDPSRTTDEFEVARLELSHPYCSPVSGSTFDGVPGRLVWCFADIDDRTNVTNARCSQASAPQVRHALGQTDYTYGIKHDNFVNHRAVLGLGVPYSSCWNCGHEVESSAVIREPPCSCNVLVVAQEQRVATHGAVAVVAAADDGVRVLRVHQVAVRVVAQVVDLLGDEQRPGTGCGVDGELLGAADDGVRILRVHQVAVRVMAQVVDPAPLTMPLRHSPLAYITLARGGCLTSPISC